LENTGIGDGYASLVQQGQTLYTAGDKGETSFVVALNATDGKPIWSSKLGKSGPVGDPKFDGPRGTPDDGWRLFVHARPVGGPRMLRIQFREEIWRKDLTKDLAG
jgi:outer membrane protein assembly factor BamB